jgi:hypothetical protein
MYTHLSGLADTCHKAGIVPSVAHIEEFSKGFTRGKNLFDFIDVGPGNERASEKISGKFFHHGSIQQHQICYKLEAKILLSSYVLKGRGAP